MKFRIEQWGEDDGAEICEEERKLQKNFYFMATTVMPAVVGVKTWDPKTTRHSLLRDVATVTDETFALLCLENYKVKWRRQHKNEMHEQQLRKSGGSPSSAPTKGTIPKPRYTLGRTGWNDKGLGRFRALNDLVAKGRAYANSSEWDCRYKNRREEEYKNAIRTTTAAPRSLAVTVSTAASHVPVDNAELERFLYD